MSTSRFQKDWVGPEGTFLKPRAVDGSDMKPALYSAMWIRRYTVDRLIYVIVLNLGIGLSAYSQTQSKMPSCSSPLLPPGLEDHLKASFPSWRVKLPSDLKPFARGDWSSLKPVECPGVAWGRFEPGSHVVYAFLLVPSARPHSAYRLVIARWPDQGTASFKVLDQSDSAGEGDYFIRGVRLREIFNETFLRTLRVQDGILLADWAETEYGNNVYFWRNGKYAFEPVELNSKDLTLPLTP